MRRCTLWLFAVVTVHALLSVCSETYGGLMGIPLAALGTGVFSAIAGHREHAEYRIVEIADAVPTALVAEGVIIAAVGMVICRRRRRPMHRSGIDQK